MISRVLLVRLEVGRRVLACRKERTLADRSEQYRFQRRKEKETSSFYSNRMMVIKVGRKCSRWSSVHPIMNWIGFLWVIDAARPTDFGKQKIAGGTTNNGVCLVVAWCRADFILGPHFPDQLLSKCCGNSGRGSG